MAWILNASKNLHVSSRINYTSERKTCSKWLRVGGFQKGSCNFFKIVSTEVSKEGLLTHSVCSPCAAKTAMCVFNFQFAPTKPLIQFLVSFVPNNRLSKSENTHRIYRIARKMDARGSFFARTHRCRQPAYYA
jgi:hypothetical protein